MQKWAIVALTCLLAPGEARAQYSIADPPLNIRWGFAVGPSTATSTGRTARLPKSEQCFSCPLTEEIVSGADLGRFHAGLFATGMPNKLGLGLHVELMFNRTTSEPFIAPPRTCPQALRCEQVRKAEDDQAIMFVSALEYSPPIREALVPYVSLGGGVQVNKLKWRQDSSTTSSLTGKAITFGPFLAVGGGVRATVGRWGAFIEWRTFKTFVTPGAQMTPLSFGIQVLPRRVTQTSGPDA